MQVLLFLGDVETASAQQELETKVGAESSETSLRLLVERLSSTEFADRQQATRDLLKVPVESVAMLEQIAATSPGETKFRLGQILERLHRSLFDDELDAFLQTPTVEIAQRLPQWDRFKSICGDNGDSRIIFGQILNAERRLFSARLFTPDQLPPLLESRTAELSKTF
ncbi:MAG: hypothetical protein HC944_03735 [Nanoarchaeota archaeon]|nr:hypothetical protein [Nanoarchaeota archaeon]